ncbi:hypothetical protein WA158_008488 [Blastocystis sp. Blastoise]
MQYFITFFIWVSFLEVCDKEEITMAYLNFKSPIRHMHLAYSALVDRLKCYLGADWEPSSCVYVYYEDPLVRTHEDVHWCVGTILKNNEEDLLSECGDDIYLVTIPSSQALQASFPFRNMLSYGIGAKKSFDALINKLEENHMSTENPPIEIHDFEDNEDIHYYIYLNQNDEFQEMMEQPYNKLE